MGLIILRMAQPDSRQDVRQALEAQRRAVMAELRAYPPRVAGCDVQFNALLEARERLGAALQQLDALGDATPVTLAAFIEAAGLDAETRAELRRLIR